MTQPIQPGDLVMVVRGHICAVERFGGIPYRVGWLEMSPGGLHCNICGEKPVYGPGMTANWKGARMPLSWLKRIDPLKEPESVERPEEVTA